jgi:uncharacterized short protein YbdD (DUF466 family)
LKVTARPDPRPLTGDDEPARATPADRPLVERLSGWLGFAWRRLREATGDDAYERYLRHHARVHPGQAPLSRKAYFAEELERKWSGPRRCC